MTSWGPDQSPGEVVDDLMEVLRGEATPGRAAKEKAYLKSDLDFLGGSGLTVREAVKYLPDPDRARLRRSPGS